MFRQHMLEAIFQVMKVIVKYRKGQKPLKEIALHLKTTLATTPINDLTLTRAYPENASFASGNPVAIKRPNLHNCLCDQIIFFGRVDKG